MAAQTQEPKPGGMQNTFSTRSDTASHFLVAEGTWLSGLGSQDTHHPAVGA